MGLGDISFPRKSAGCRSRSSPCFPGIPGGRYRLRNRGPECKHLAPWPPSRPSHNPQVPMERRDENVIMRIYCWAPCGSGFVSLYTGVSATPSLTVYFRNRSPGPNVNRYSHYMRGSRHAIPRGFGPHSVVAYLHSSHELCAGGAERGAGWRRPWWRRQGSTCRPGAACRRSRSPATRRRSGSP
jgi:hypothetical protein